MAFVSASVGMLAIMTLAAFPLVNKINTAEAAPGAKNQSNSSITMTSGYSSAELNLTPSADGAFSYSSSEELAKFEVTTNNFTGYTLSIEGSDNTRQLTNSTTGTVLDSISSTISESVFDTSAYNGKWGYRPSKYNSTDNVGFLQAPTTTPSTLNITTCANGAPTTNCPDNQTVDEYTIGLGARVDMTKPAGTYTNTFILTAVGNPIVYTINYSKGDITDTVSNLPASQSGSVSTTSVTLSSTIPTRANYTFLYWCLGTLGNNSTTCDGTTYNAGSSFGIDQTIDNTTTLYAVWSPNITIKTATGISKVTLNGTETSSTSGTTVTGLVYGQSYTLTASLQTGYSFTSWSAGSYGSVAANNASTTYTVGAGPSTITPTATINSYLQTVQVRYQTATGTWGSYSTYSACTKNVNYGSSHSCSIAATTEYQAASLSSYTVTGTNTKQIDVYRNTRTVSLTKGTGINTVAVTGTGVKSGSNTASATVYYGGAVTIAATMLSNYDWVNWTGSATYTSQSQSISSVTSNLSFTANGKSSCSSTISGTMQAFNPSNLCSDVTSGSLTDSRDNQTYTVAKIGSLWWMTRNLAIGCAGSGSTYSATVSSKSLTSSNSNVSATWSTPTTSLTSGNSYDNPRMTCNATYGAWYNYAAATAGTITGSSNSTEASYSVCPAGWRLPTNSEQSGITSSASAFSPVTGGSYYNGSLNATGSGYWWSSTAYDTTNRYTLYWNGSSLDTSNSRRSGVYIRCVRS